ncbi:L,D-transpeptidase [Legionella micdadei]|uniref:L,D-transpeptidase family protein n=1 Tax=Legionella micdadei TaxID=451 RepID=UPI0020A38A5C|nr:L,D-transpeptidase [Legionella micdadei]
MDWRNLFPELAAQHPGRDWILSRILQLDGLEEGRNKGGDVDSLRRCIYIHGTPDTTDLGKPGSRGCIRMRNSDLIELVNWVALDTKICIE